ncbi:hypothetical protein PTKIN_Ptkin01aG0388700 [Pterospermum kingtungense]
MASTSFILHHHAFNLAPTISRSSSQRPQFNIKPSKLVCRAPKLSDGDGDASRRSVLNAFSVGCSSSEPAFVAPANGDDELPVSPGQVPGKQSWPELVGEKKEVAVETIEKENPYVNVVVLPENAPMDRMYNPTRVRVWVDKNGVVLREPSIPRTG